VESLGFRVVASSANGRAWIRLFVVGWPWLLALVVMLPVLAPGYVLSYDMVWFADLPLRADALGAGSQLPRAVPSDAVVAILDEVVPGQVLQKVLLLGVLGMAGTGLMRLMPDALPARLAAAALYVWNPFVAERLVLGHWPLLLGYAALPWVVQAAVDLGRATPRAWARLTLLLGVAAMSPIGGLMVGLVALVFAVAFAARRRRVAIVVVLTVLAVNAPWIVSGLVHGGGASDPSAVEMFDLQSEGRLGRLLSALTLGGIWNREVVPESRQGLLAAVLSIAILCVAILGAVEWWRRSRRCALAAGICTIVAVAVAIAGWLAPHGVAWLVEHVLAAGLLRDGTRLLAVLALAEAFAFGLGVHALSTRLRSAAAAAFVATAGLIMPLVAMPDLAWGVASRLEPIDYPEEWDEVVAAVDQERLEGVAVVLPFTAFRAPDWNGARPVLNPLAKAFTRTTVVNDDLMVSGTRIEGEDPRSARVQALLGEPEGLRRLPELGIGIVVVDGDPGADVRRQLADATSILTTAQFSVYELDGAVRAADRPSSVVVAIGWGMLIGTLLAALWGVFRGTSSSWRVVRRGDATLR
jgi:hypothetical protein